MEAYYLLGESDILERVDEYTLYCHYLQFEPELGETYSSPFRDDDEHPSFSLFYPTRIKSSKEILWKDNGLGVVGDIFGLVQRLYGYRTRQEGVRKVKSDFGLGLKVPDRERIVTHIERTVVPADIRVRTRRFSRADLEWWGKRNISEEILKRYRTSRLFCYWSRPGQKTAAFPADPAYVYRIFDRYQLYFPTRDRGNKFRMDLQAEHMLGMEQLVSVQTASKRDLLVLTKSYKDVMCAYSLGYDAIAPRSETTPPPSGLFDWIAEHYHRAVVLFDNDGKHKAEWYPYPLVTIPVSTGTKDLSDFMVRYQATEAAELMRQLTAA